MHEAVVIIELQTKPQQTPSVQALFQSWIPDILGFQGCLSAVLHVNEEDAANLMLIERWTSREQYENYRDWRRNRGDHVTLTPMLVRPPLVRAFDVVV
jgi:quinol monooxygenase YgiN